jgi:RimJ/RimL family protein N-acetyltransferase
MINLQPTLIGKLAKIRPLLTQDFEPLYAAAADKLLWAQHPLPQRAERDFFKTNYFDTAIACKGGLIFENLEGEAIGGSRYYNYREQERDIMIGYTFLIRKCWGSAYNREIKHLLLTHIYQWVDTVYFAVGENNTRSRNAMSKIGGILQTK